MINSLLLPKPVKPRTKWYQISYRWDAAELSGIINELNAAVSGNPVIVKLAHVHIGKE